MRDIVDERLREDSACVATPRSRIAGAQGTLAALLVTSGAPWAYNGQGFTASLVREWYQELGLQTLLIELSSPWESGHLESFNGRFRDRLLTRKTYCTLTDEKFLVDRWRRQFEAPWPHSALGYHPRRPKLSGRSRGRRLTHAWLSYNHWTDDGDRLSRDPSRYRRNDG